MTNIPLTTLEEVLKQFPRFYDKRADSVNYRMSETLSEQLRKLKQNRKLIKLSAKVARPLRIWREQILPYQFTLKIRVALEDIKQVKLYQDGEPPILLHDSGILDLGTDTFSYDHPSTSDDVIPIMMWYIEVETYNDEGFVKGFPHNQVISGNKYDHEQDLDVFGLRFGVPRRIYKDGIVENDYPTTYPKYCADSLEWDACYEQRLNEWVDDYQTKKLPVVELKKYFGIEPTIEGRWRALCYMDESYQDDKYMSTSEWDYPVYDVSANLNAIPSNITIPDEAMIYNVLKKTFPISKKVYWQLLTYLDTPIQIESLIDEVRFSLILGSELPLMKDSVTYTTAGATTQNVLGISDYVILQTGQTPEINAFKEQINKIEYYSAYFHDTDTDFALDTKSYVIVVGTGSGAYVKLDAVEGYQGWSTGNQFYNVDRGITGNAWNYGGDTPLEWAKYADGTGVRCDISTSERYSDLLRVQDHHFSIPTNAQIKGIQLRVRKRQSGTVAVHDDIVELVLYGGATKGANKATGNWWSQTYADTWYGGDTDLWGTSWTPAEINYGEFGAQVALRNDSSYNISAWVDVIQLTVWYRTADGYLQSQTITKDVSQTAWDTISTNQSVPAQCTLLYDVLRASDSAVLLSNQSAPINISSIENVDIKVKAKFTTTDVTYTPTLDWMRVKGKKPY